jgi:hypothetical protein
VDWLAACFALRVIGALLVFSYIIKVKICTIFQPMGSKGRYVIPEEIYQTLLTNKKQGN